MNPIIVNSSNVLNFGYSAIFKLYEKKITFDISQLTTFVSGHAGNVLGVYFKVIDPSGLIIKDIDLTTPDIIPTGTLTFDVAIPSATFGFGWFTLVGVLQDQDAKQYTVTLRKNVCLPEGFDGKSVEGKMSALVNCYSPSVKLSEETVFSYIGKSPSSLVKSGTLYYPQGTLSNITFIFTPFAISGAGQVFTGDYLVKNVSTAQYDLGDSVYVEIKYFTNFKFTVECNSSLGSVICCLENVKSIYDNGPQSERGIDAYDKLQKASIPLYTAICKEKVGQDASEEVAEIKKILDCDCDLTSENVEPTALGIDTGNPVIIQLQAAGAVSIVSSTAGNTTNYTISSKTVQLQKDINDLNFSITRTDSQYGTVYTIAFDYTALANTIINTIAGNAGYIATLKSILNINNSNVDLSGLLSNCVLAVNNCNYLLAEANSAPKTVVSIVIDNVVRNAPTSTLLSNVSAVQTWLNGLSLGTFAVSLDSGTNTINIVSNNNTHAITAFNMTVAGNPLIRQFSKSCTTLVGVLNAITAYVCAIDGTQVKFGVSGQQIYTFNSDGTINKTNVASYASLGGVLTSIINAQNALYTSFSGLGLTCANVKTLFVPVDKTLLSSDGVLGTKAGQCAFITNDEYASIILQKIAASPALQSILCGAVANCSGPVCSPVTNVSATFASGSLTINCNDNGGGSTPIKIRYRINNSGNTFTTVTTTASALPLTTGSGLTNAQYEVQVAKTCTNGVDSPWVAAVSANTCPAPVAFNVVISGSNFAISATLTSPQTKLELTITDPNGGVSTTIHDFGATSGTYNVAIPSGLYGNYTFVARAVCDSTATPIFASVFTSPININNPNPAANNIFAYANYGMVFTDISNGTASGIPTSFNSTSIPGSKSDYTPALTGGTVSFTVTGTPPSGLPIYGRLVKNGTTIISQVAITAAGTYTLTNPATISAPDQISIEIDS